MTIEENSIVDMMGLNPDTETVILGISDHLDWDQENHLTLFEQKVGSYLDFIRSGQLVTRMPVAAGKSIRIELICQFEPTQHAVRFLEAAKKQLSNDERVEFEYRVLPPV